MRAILRALVKMTELAFRAVSNKLYRIFLSTLKKAWSLISWYADEPLKVI